MCKPHWIKRKVESGNIVEESIFLAYPKKAWMHKSTAKTKSKKVLENFRCRVRNLSRFINSNYSPGDLFVTLTYSRLGYSYLKSKPTTQTTPRDVAFYAAKEELQLFLARCKYHAQKAGVPFKAIYITSDIKSSTGHYARVHHLLVNNEATDIVRDCWKHGHTKITPLKNQVDYAPIAYYFLEQTRTTEDQNSFGRTQSVLAPIISDTYLVNLNGKLVAPEDAQVLSSGFNHLKYCNKK